MFLEQDNGDSESEIDTSVIVSVGNLLDLQTENSHETETLPLFEPHPEFFC